MACKSASLRADNVANNPPDDSKRTAATVGFIGGLCPFLLTRRFHLRDVLLCKEDIVHPVHSESHKKFQIVDVFVFPLSRVVRFIVSKPSGARGAGLDICIGNIFRDADSQPSVANLILFFWGLTASEVLYQELQCFPQPDANEL